jgi:predicted membrane-bound spermidine synthase
MGSGAGILMLEVLGARIAGPVFGVGLYIWTALISVTLASLAFGYWLGGIVCDRKPSADLLYALVGAAGILTLVVPAIDGPVMTTCHRAMGLRVGVLASTLVLFAPTLTLLAMVSPFALKLSLADLRSTGRTAGSLFAVSTIGSVLGAIAVGYLLIPALGVAATSSVVTAVVVAPALGWFAIARRFAPLLAIVVAGTVAQYVAWRSSTVSAPPGAAVVVMRDGPYGQVKVIDAVVGGEAVRWLLLDGTMQTGIRLDSGTPVLPYAQLMLDVLESRGARSSGAARRALLIGLGGGALVRPLVDAGYTVDVVEIDPVIAEIATSHFGVRPESFELIVEDGRSYIRSTRNVYDVVLMDVASGGAQPFHLFSQEAFSEVRAILSDDGLLGVNALALREPTEHDVAAALFVTATSVFSWGEAYIGDENAAPKTLANIVMFFSPSERRAAQPATALQRQRITIDPRRGIVATDDRNPLEVWSVELNQTWRENVFEGLGEELLTL